MKYTKDYLQQQVIGPIRDKRHMYLVCNRLTLIGEKVAPINSQFGNAIKFCGGIWHSTKDVPTMTPLELKQQYIHQLRIENKFDPLEYDWYALDKRREHTCPRCEETPVPVDGVCIDCEEVLFDERTEVTPIPSPIENYLQNDEHSKEL